MGLCCEFVVRRHNGDGRGDGSGEFADEDGWADFGDWVAGQDQDGEGWPAVATLVEWWHSDDPDAVEGELARLVAERPGRPGAAELAVAGRLLAAVRGRPKGTEQILITDDSDTGE